MFKKIHVLAVLFFISLVSCNSEKTPHRKDTVITGKVNGYNGKNADLYIKYSQPGTTQYKEPLTIDSLGNFKFTLFSTIPLDASILDKESATNIYFIYHPKDSIHLEFTPDTKTLPQLKTVKFSGDNAKTNNLLNTFQITREEKNLGYSAITDNQMEAKITDFIESMNSLKTRQTALVKEFKKKYSLNKEEETWINAFAFETYYYFLDFYSFGKSNIPNNYYHYYSKLQSIDSTNLSAWRNLSYMVNSYYMHYISPSIRREFNPLMEEIKNGNIDTDSLVLDYFNKNTKNPLLKELLIARYYTTQFDSKTIVGYRKNKNTIERYVKDSFISKNLKARYKETLEFLNKNKADSENNLTNMKGMPTEDVFSSIIEAHQGKVIYVDVWATWCGPCIKAMPDAKKLLKKLEDKNIAFVYLCIESKEELWKTMVSNFNLGGGEHYLMSSEQSAYFRNTFDITAIPQYFIIGAKGNILEMGENLHPSQVETEAQLLSALP